MVKYLTYSLGKVTTEKREKTPEEKIVKEPLEFLSQIALPQITYCNNEALGS